MLATAAPMLSSSRTDTAASADAAHPAESAGLVYACDEEPGICRRGTGPRTAYLDAGGKRLRDPQTLDRIRALAIPPAWTSVWICPDPDGHIQATGRDARGRKQYIYHPRWREMRDATKFAHIVEFAEVLPLIRARVDADMRRRGSPREKVIAAIVHLLDTTLIRIGNAEYAEQNDSYGLTTLRDRHAVIEGAELRFVFVGKSGKAWSLKLRDRRVARVVRDCQEIPGQRLFQYFDEAGERRAVSSSDVNAYLREISGADITAKDFRTWAGTVLAAARLSQFDPFASSSEAKRNLNAAIKDVAGLLGNTPAICRKCYVHPAIFDAYLGERLLEELRRGRRAGRALKPGEGAVLALLRRRLAGTAPRARSSKGKSAAHGSAPKSSAASRRTRPVAEAAREFASPA